jgi:hypothetical protein
MIEARLGALESVVLQELQRLGIEPVSEVVDA